VVAAVALVAVGFRLFTGVGVLDSMSIAAGVVSLFFIVGMLSSVNLIDGHDGLAAGVALIASSAFAVIGAMDGAAGVTAASLAIAGACLGFLLFNFPPARIYMGDTGAMLLGMTLAQVACLITMRSPSLETFVGVLLVLGCPFSTRCSRGAPPRDARAALRRRPSPCAPFCVTRACRRADPSRPYACRVPGRQALLPRSAGACCPWSSVWS
jgi:UDP-N-acetylmuramyl pentapeptide phosphotransferase/UDP-N-acetylglucosamine-1-phosphate transferase